MSYAEEIKKLLTEKRPTQKTKEYVDYVNQLENKGIATKKEYDLPLVDTIGRVVFEKNKQAIEA